MNVVFCCLLSLSMGAAASAQTNQVKLDSGEIAGVAAGNVIAFKGIPFAAPPVGLLRWRAPQPVKAWTGVRSAREYAHDCMQLPFPGDAAPLGTPPAEDCLYANVWMPASTSSGVKLPVMVWIYGGGFVNGGSSPEVYSGAKFAAEGVVLVSFNYRVGRFGFFAFPELTKEDPDRLLGNYGFMDQIAALKWVQRNASAFGGDPNNVTIFGESAGGFSVHTLLTSPLSQKLFAKAIIESGGGRTNLGGQRYLSTSLPGGPTSAESVGVAFAQSMGINGTDAEALAQLRQLPAERVRGQLNMASMGDPTYPGPMVDGRLVIADPQSIYLAGLGAAVPILVGANSMDIGFGFAPDKKTLFAAFGSNESKAKSVYDPSGDTPLKEVQGTIAMDRMMIEPARFVASVYASRGVPAYEYRFSYVAESMRKEWPGAPHATEIPFVFDTVSARYGEKLTAADEKLAKAALRYWITFAKTGNPGGNNDAAWPRYNPATDQLLDFATTGPVAKSDPWKARLDVIAATVSSTAPYTLPTSTPVKK